MKSRLAFSSRSSARSRSSAPGPVPAHRRTTQCAPAAAIPAATTPVAFWSTEARCAIVPPARPGLRLENFGNKFPGEAAVYMGIVHVAIYDAAVAIEGGYRPYVSTQTRAGDTSAAAAIATAAHDTLVGLRRARPGRGAAGDPRRRLRRLHGRRSPTARRRRRASPSAERVARAVLALRANDGLETQPDGRRPRPARARPRRLAAERPGPVLGLRLPGIRPLALASASQFRPRRPQRADQPGVRRRPQPGRAARPRRQHDQDARADDPGAVLDRPRHPAVERRHAPPRQRRAASTSCRPPACWRWRTSPAATR